ncbi:copper chaperone PCu(A)C [Paeniglutamicibacter cryotolerans]|uniref:Copper chaperone PCu(A)C n=1 Tax=Paeniglutamicibacter cryotolerans TaxID=670079 RepID=A0A839QJW6_9MICC|nr:copper chaperone PCu(A)C [Paeniglutamicibacter cryotolerans]MBB2994326.1 hypothetical protein [Paeniglutamicibacter cryotolerans]
MSFVVPSSRAALIPAFALTLMLASCAAPAQPPAESHDVAQTATQDEPAPLHVHDAWIKAADGGMTSAFATLHNESAEPLTLSGASSDIADDIELHEMTGGTGATSMKELPGGITVEPGASVELAPGGLHLMLMGVHEAVKPGQSPVIALELADGSTIPVRFEVKSFTGANESYAPESEHGMGH